MKNLILRLLILLPIASFAASHTPINNGILQSDFDLNGFSLLNYSVQAQHKVYAGPSSGADAAPGFRLLVSADIPSLSYDALNAAHDATNGLPSAAFHAASDFATPAQLVAATNSTTLNAQGLALISGTVTFVTQPAINTFASASNSITMSTNINNVFFFLASTAVSLTNVTLSIAGQMTYADLISSNSLATSITNYMTIPGAKIFGVNSASTATNALIIPAGKEAYWHIECRGVNETNVFCCLQQ